MDQLVGISIDLKIIFFLSNFNPLFDFIFQKIMKKGAFPFPYGINFIELSIFEGPIQLKISAVHPTLSQLHVSIFI